MSDACRPFIHPDTAIKTNRNGSKQLAIAEATLSQHRSRPRDLQPNQKDRFSGHYGVIAEVTRSPSRNRRPLDLRCSVRSSFSDTTKSEVALAPEGLSRIRVF